MTRLQNGWSRYLEATQVKPAAHVYTPAASPVILEPTTSQSDADQCQPHGAHLEATQVKPAADIHTLAASPVNLKPTTSQSDADQCQPHGEHLEVTQDEPAAHIYAAVERRQAREGAAGPQYFVTQKGTGPTSYPESDNPSYPGNGDVAK